MIADAVIGLVSSWFNAKTAVQEAKADRAKQEAKSESDYDTTALKQMQFSYKDEFAMLVWYSPIVLAWVYPEKAQAWVDFVGGLPHWYQLGMLGILASTFGLRWLFRQQQVKILKGKNE